MRHPRFLNLLILFLALLLVAQPLPAGAQGDDTQEQIDALLDTLRNGDLLEQEQAAQELAELGSRLAVPGLIDIFQSTDNPRPAAMALAGIGTPTAMVALIAPLADDELTARRNAAQIALLEVGEDAVSPLRGGLASGNPVMRRNAAELLGFISSPSAVNSLLQVALADDDPRVRQEAVWALGEIGEPRIRLTLRSIYRTDPDPGVRFEAQRAVLRLGEMF